jgi:ubiquitin carboxyl-terminal hydrolase 44/49
VDSTNQEASLCKSLHAIFRVMWSGKWAMVTPHAVLSAVWSKIPDFRGYSQQDAHEFLCELLSELQSELNEFPDSVAVIFSEPMRSVIVPSEIISSSFEGRLRSAVVCNTCNGVSEVIEPFYDLSLDFPPRYQAHCSSRASTNSPCSCALSELLDYFTARETLEDCIYSCSFCNEARGGESLEFQSATKQLSLHKPPDVLRLHLKRFRWHETDRAKISTHVSFPTTLDITPFCSPQNDTNKSSHLHYDLTSVIMHHGKGFASGHYTAYCYNTEASSWVHCNDSRVSLCTEDEVLNSQAYILFYRRLSSLAATVQPTYSTSSPTWEDGNARKRVRLF